MMTQHILILTSEEKCVFNTLFSKRFGDLLWKRLYNLSVDISYEKQQVQKLGLKKKKVVWLSSTAHP